MEIDIPRMLFGAYLVSLWGVLESSYIQIAEKYRESAGTGLRLSDLKGDFPDKVVRYYGEVLGKPHRPDGFNWEILHDLFLLRNVYAERSGRVAFLEEGEKGNIARLEKMGALDVKSAEDSIVPSAAYLESVTMEIGALIRDNMKIYAKEYGSPNGVP